MSGGRPHSFRSAAAVVAAAVLIAAVIWATAAPSPSGAADASPSSVSSASTSSRGVTKSTINVVFPVVSLNSLAGQEGFAQDAEFEAIASQHPVFVLR